MPALSRALIAEAVGTYLLVLFGTGSVAAAVLTGAQVGLGQVAVVWGFGVTLAIYASAAVSGAHLNPAVSLAFALREHASRAAGAYVTFLADEGAARVREAYPGTTWDRLTRINARYDPANFFRLNQNIPPV